MRNWKKTLVDQKVSIRSAVKIIDSSSLQIALVVDANERLVGVVTDGDVRRCILAGVSLDEPVDRIMFRDFTYARETDCNDQILNLMKRKDIRHMPIIDSEGIIVDLKLLNDFLDVPLLDNPVVIMAGGLGTRLLPLTEQCPKPMLKVGEKPILETIIDNFKAQGFWRFYLAVNYKSHMVEDYFGDGKKWGVQIEYLREKKRMGTAGALSLLETLPDLPIVVMNGDVLSKINFNHLLEFHEQSRSSATMCVREYEYQIPYGVVQVEGQYLKALKEKPVQSFLVNAGIYVLSSEVLSQIPQDTYYDITSLFETMLGGEIKPNVFPIREYWIDIGRMNDFEQAKGDFHYNFCSDENEA